MAPACKSSLIGSAPRRWGAPREVTHPGVAGHLQLRQLAERTVDAHLVGTEVDRDGLALHQDYAAKAVLVMGDTILNGILLDLLNGLEVVEGTAGKESPARRGSRAHSFSMPSSGEANLGTRQGSIGPSPTVTGLTIRLEIPDHRERDLRPCLEVVPKTTLRRWKRVIDTGHAPHRLTPDAIAKGALP